MKYAELKKEIENLPVTWCGGILAAVVQTTIKKKFFVPGGVTRFVNTIEDTRPFATETGLSVVEMVERLAARGLLPCEHNLEVWQCADGDTWGAAINAADPKLNIEGFGDSMEAALAALMVMANRGADLKRG
jgi:hypothetical protein